MISDTRGIEREKRCVAQWIIAADRLL